MYEYYCHSKLAKIQEYYSHIHLTNSFKIQEYYSHILLKNSLKSHEYYFHILLANPLKISQLNSPSIQEYSVIQNLKKP